MDVQQTTRERVFSILNDNNCPSFVIKQKPYQSSSSPAPASRRLPPISSFGSFSPRVERPSLPRQPGFERNNSISSAGSPPLLRFDSSSSSKSGSSMDSTPSPITPAYNYTEPNILPYDSLLRQDAGLAFLPSPTGITPFLDQGLMLAPMPQDAYQSKPVQQLAPAAYPALPLVADMNQIPVPMLRAEASMSSNASTAHSIKSVVSTSNPAGAALGGKKNKYPCPYSQSHSCTSTFTTSGHAARHGKKHTGEKGVHCPICDKAFTRKDNMKQHERTHKNRTANGDEKKSKAQTTRDAVMLKDLQSQDSQILIQPTAILPASLRKMSSGMSDPSDITLLSNTIDTPVDITPSFFSDSNPQIILSDPPLPLDPTGESMYPPLIDDSILAAAAMNPVTKMELNVPHPPALIRGFSDLDTLAQAAESAFDPYFQQTQQF